MNRHAIITLLIVFLTMSFSHSSALDKSFANVHDLRREEDFARRAADWRNGAIIYQVIVDRFGKPSPEQYEEKRALFEEPRVLMEWDEEPRQGVYLEEAEVWSHEIEFWGGDLQTLQDNIDWIEQLGTDVLYLNPIFMAYTNHKYDTQNYFEISPEYGDREDVIELARDLEERGMRLVLDGVFNHMGRTSPFFQEALEDPGSQWRDWYFIGDEYEMGYRGWYDVANLPELRLENPEVRARLWGDPDSVIQGYLREGVSGWRLDVAFDIGFTYLNELTRSAHEARSDSLIIGEIWNYPEEWSPAVDGVMNMTIRHLIMETVRGNCSPELLGRHIERMVEDSGLEPILKSWIILDNHDTQRLKTELPDQTDRHMAQLLQFTVPGSPCVYYGVELGMEGGYDPEMRAPMKWEDATDDNPELTWMRRLIAARRESPALRYGDFRLLDSDNLLAFLRRTNHAEELRIVLANPTNQPVKELLMVRDSKMMSGVRMADMFSDAEFEVFSGTMAVELAPGAFHLLRPRIQDTIEYNHFKRVQ